MKINVKKLDIRAKLPTYATPGSSGFDLVALERMEIRQGVPKLIRTGLAFEVPEGFELQIRARSSMSLKTKLRLANGIGTIDSDYREEVFIMMENIDQDGRAFIVNAGDRVAQGVIAPIMQVQLEESHELNGTKRTGGFGSTGK